jgi:hypothetical protein
LMIDLLKKLRETSIAILNESTDPLGYHTVWYYYHFCYISPEFIYWTTHKFVYFLISFYNLYENCFYLTIITIIILELLKSKN